MSPDVLKKEENWIISEGTFRVHHNRHFEGVFATGNGYFSTRGSLEEGLCDDNQAQEYMRLPMNVTLEKSRNMKSKWGTFVPGIVGNHPLLKEVMVNLPWMLEWKIWYKDEPLSMEQGTINHYTRFLNMKNGTLSRSFVWQTKNDAEIQLMFERFISMECDQLSVQRIRMKVIKGSGTLRINAGINGNVRTNGYNHFTSYHSFVEEDFIGAEVITDKGCQVVQGAFIESNTPFDWIIKDESHHIYYETEGNVEGNNSYEFTKLCVIATNRDLHNQNPIQMVKDTLLEKASMGYNHLQSSNEYIWNQLWNRCDIKITGNDELQKAIASACTIC